MPERRPPVLIPPLSPILRAPPPATGEWGRALTDYLETLTQALATRERVGAEHVALLDHGVNLQLQVAGLDPGDAIPIGNSVFPHSTGGVLATAVGSLRPHGVSQAKRASGQVGPILGYGQISRVKTAGAVGLHRYVRKSATAVSVEDTGVSSGDTTVPPIGALGLALTATAAAGFIEVYWFCRPVHGPQADSVGAAQIIDGSVGSAEIADGSVGTAELANDSVTPDKLSHDWPAASVSRLTNLSIANNSLVAVAYPDADDYDVGGLHDPAVNNTRLTFPRTGRYMVVGNASFAANATGGRAIALRFNGGGVLFGLIFTVNNGASRDTAMATSVFAVVNATNYVELMVFQDSGAALNILSDGVNGRRSLFQAVYVGES